MSVSGGSRRLRATIIAFGAIVLVGLWSFIGAHLHGRNQAALTAAETNLANFARAFEEHTVRTVEGVDQTLLALKQRFEADRRADLSGELARALARLGGSRALVRALLVADISGDVIAATVDTGGRTVSIGDREHFQVHAKDAASGLHISKPVLARHLRKWSIILTRRLDRPDGSFGGVVAAAVDPGYFAAFYRSINLGAGSTAMLIGHDGIIRARGADDGNSTGQDIAASALFQRIMAAPSGIFTAESPIDGRLLHHAFRSLPDYGLAVSVGVTPSQMLAATQQTFPTELLAGAVATVAILLLSALIIVQVVRLERSEAAALADRRAADVLKVEAGAARDRLAVALDALADRFALFDRDDRLVVFNHRYAEDLSAIADMIKPGAHFEDLARAAVARGAVHVPKGQEEAWIRARIEHHRNPRGKIERFRPNGSWVLIDERRTPDGGTVSLGTNITELKRREAELRDLAERNAQLAAAVEAANIGIVVTDARRPDNPIVFVNRGFTRITGYTADEALGRNPRFLQGPETDPAAVEALRNAVRDAAPVTVELRNRRKDGTVWRNEITMSPIVTESGRLIGFVGIQNDVTARKDAEERLRAAKDEADQANRAKSEFLAVMSHEIRTPLNGVLGTVGLLLETDLTDLQRRYAETAQESGTALLGILNDVLDFAKMEAGRLELEQADFRLRDVVRSVADLMRPRAVAKGIDLDLNVNPDVPPNFRGDPGRLTQILMNLVSNAVKFTEKGLIALNVRLERSDGPMLLVNFSVVDTGVGITREDQERLFSSFTQVDASRTRRASGTGLGLAICKRLVEMMGGAIGVESAPGAGSTFWFTIPLGVPEYAPAPAAPIAVDIAPDGAGAATGRILVVDDSPTNLMVAAGFLQGAGFAVDTLDNGAAAIAAIRKIPYDAVLMDVSMPVMDGIAATMEIRALGGRFRSIPIIAMTAHVLGRDRAACMEAGMNDYMAKPVRKDVLLSVVRRWVGQSGPAAPAASPAPDPAAAEGALIDPDTLALLAADLDAETFAKLLQTFLSETESRILRMQAAAESGDRDSLAREAHSLKSSAATFGAARLSRLAAAIERAAVSGPDCPGVADIASLAMHAAEACNALRTHRMA